MKKIISYILSAIIFVISVLCLSYLLRVQPDNWLLFSLALSGGLLGLTISIILSVWTALEVD